MGAKTWMLVASSADAVGVLRSNPPLDEAATLALVATLFPTGSAA